MGGFVGQLVEVRLTLRWSIENQAYRPRQRRLVMAVMEALLTEPKDRSPTMAHPSPNGCAIVNHATKAE